MLSQPALFVRILELLGSGQFGNVSRGTWKSPKGVIEVAVKTLVTKEKKVGRVKLLQEAAIMGQFSHPNVIKLLGVVTKKDSVSESS
jgi:serine/threonine protein kinase